MNTRYFQLCRRLLAVMNGIARHILRSPTVATRFQNNMAKRLPVSLNYATHLPALMRALELSSGRVLELGMGLFSTPYLHYACLLAGRPLVSYDNNAEWVEFFYGHYASPDHVIKCVEFDNADLGGEWGVALVDHSPSARRVVDIRRLADGARYVIAHDSNREFDGEYRYKSIYPLFKYRQRLTYDRRQTVVLSNHDDLKGFLK